jgi:hypothetical protein
MSARRIAVLVGSHDPAYFARQTQLHRPSEGAVLAALRAQYATREPNYRATATQTITDHDWSIARHPGARVNAGRRRARVADPGGPSRIMSGFAAAARTRVPTRHMRARIRANAISGA